MLLSTSEIDIPLISDVSLFLSVLMSCGGVAGRVWEGCQSAVMQGKNFLKQGLKQCLLVHSERNVKGRGGLDSGFLL